MTAMGLGDFAVKVKKGARLLARRGPRAFFARLLRGGGTIAAPTPKDFTEPLPPEHAGVFVPKVLIVAELSIPQCRLYRVEHKVKILEADGWSVEVVSWTDAEKCRHEMQTARLLIVYRAPFIDSVRELYKEAHRLGIRVGFDIDDLVFDIEEYSRNSNVLSLPTTERASLMAGAALYRDALAAADFSIASTPSLAERMRKTCKGPCYVLPNSLGYRSTAGRWRFPLGLGGEVVIGYGSGTKTHDRDFAMCAKALERVLDECPDAVFALHGMLELPKSFDRFASRIHRVPFVSFSEYSDVISRFDINLAPLEATVFNDCKSNIKFLEAAWNKVPTVASPCAEFRSVIQDGVNGFLASNEEQWHDALRRLVESAEMRRSLGEAAHKTASARFSMDVIANGAMADIIKAEAQPLRESSRRRVLVVNVLYAPTSYGGATVLAENLVAGFAKEVDVAVFTTMMDVRHAKWHIMRYSHGGVPCFLCEIPVPPDPSLNYEAPEVAKAFAEVLEAFRPDAVHFNSIQFMGVEMLMECRKRDVPYCVTVHDAWWICPRQFLLDGNGRYCGQGDRGIDMYRCVECTERKDLFSRRKLLEENLVSAFAVLAPSDYQRNLYVRSGIPESLVRTCRNGIVVPAQVRPHRRQPVLTFAYLGGKCDHKGYYMLQRIVKRLHGEWRLKLVDLELRFNRRAMSALEWESPSKIEICEPFNPCDIDAFYESVDVLLAPSCMPESFGMTVREALVRNIWVVATNAGGDISHDLLDGENGDLVPLGDEDGFVAAVQRLIDSPDRLDGFVNPRRGSITTVAEQADETLKFFSDALGWNLAGYASPWTVAPGVKEEDDSRVADEARYLKERCRILTLERDYVKSMYDTMSTSTCWRMTGPLRAVLDALKRWKRRCFS